MGTDQIFVGLQGTSSSSYRVLIKGSSDELIKKIYPDIQTLSQTLINSAIALERGTAPVRSIFGYSSINFHIVLAENVTSEHLLTVLADELKKLPYPIAMLTEVTDSELNQMFFELLKKDEKTVISTNDVSNANRFFHNRNTHNLNLNSVNVDGNVAITHIGNGDITVKDVNISNGGLTVNAFSSDTSSEQINAINSFVSTIMGGGRSY